MRITAAVACLTLAFACGPSGANGGFISLPISGTKPFGNAEFSNFAIAQRFRYMRFAPTGVSSLTSDFSIPLDYFAGTPITIRVMSNNANPTCFVVLGADSVWETFSVSANADVEFPGEPRSANPRVPIRNSELRPFSFRLYPFPGREFEPGDSLSVSLYRYGDELNDTCPSEILISGLAVYYANSDELFADGFE